MEVIRGLKYHLKQFYISYKTKHCKGDMDFLTYHCYRIWKIYDLRYIDKMAINEIYNPITKSTYEIVDGTIVGIKNKD